MPAGLGLDRGDGRVEGVPGNPPGDFRDEPFLALGAVASSSIITAISRVEAVTSVIAWFGSIDVSTVVVSPRRVATPYNSAAIESSGV